MDDRDRLDVLTERWRARHEERRPAADARPVAAPERQELAARAFPYQSLTPEMYVEEHGAEMIGFTYDEERYDDPDLDDWLLRVGGLLRANRPEPLIPEHGCG